MRFLYIDSNTLPCIWVPISVFWISPIYIFVFYHPFGAHLRRKKPISENSLKGQSKMKWSFTCISFLPNGRSLWSGGRRDGSVEVVQDISGQYVRERSLQKGDVFRFFHSVSAASWKTEAFVSRWRARPGNRGAAEPGRKRATPSGQ